MQTYDKASAAKLSNYPRRNQSFFHSPSPPLVAAPPPSPRCEACHTILRSLTLPYESCSLATPLNGGTIKLIAAGRCLNPHAKGLSNLRPFSATLLHNLPAPAGHNLRRSRAPFPFIFSARRAPPSPLNPLHPGGFAAPIKKHPLSRVLFIDGFPREISLRTVPAWCLQLLQYR